MSFAVSSIAMMGIGAASSTVGAYYSAAGQKSSLGFAAGIADLNARAAEQGAQVTLQGGERQYQSSRLSTAALKGKQRAGLAANGVDLGVGSAVSILTTTDVMGEIDANTIQANAVRQAWGYRTQATAYENEAMMKRASASAINPGMAAFTTMLTEGSKVAGAYAGLSKAGAFDKSPMGGNPTSNFYQYGNRGSGD